MGLCCTLSPSFIILAPEENCQKLRIMTFAPYLAHTEPIFNSLELLPVQKIFINRIGIVMFKYSCDMLPDPIANLYSKNKDYHSHNTRNKNHLKVPAGTKNFTSNSARIWNTISTKMNVNVTLVQFKANLKLYLLTLYSALYTFVYTKSNTSPHSIQHANNISYLLYQ